MYKIRKDDKVKILAGKDRGRIGKVLSVDKKAGRAVVEDANIYFRHEQAKRQGQKGQKIQVPMPVRLSNLMLVCSSCKKPSRTRIENDEKKGKQRICIKCGKKN